MFVVGLVWRERREELSGFAFTCICFIIMEWIRFIMLTIIGGKGTLLYDLLGTCLQIIFCICGASGVPTEPSEPLKRLWRCRQCSFGSARSKLSIQELTRNSWHRKQSQSHIHKEFFLFLQHFRTLYRSFPLDFVGNHPEPYGICS